MKKKLFQIRFLLIKKQIVKGQQLSELGQGIR